MRQDIISDVLNEVMNARKAGKENLMTNKSSKLLLKVLEIMKQYGYIDYELQENGKLKIILKEIRECKAIKPRYTVNKEQIEKYMRRFLPARNFGYVVISTNKGLMTHMEARENKIGGSLIAYFY
jgi:small subunit ribosomal protein S8